MLQIVIDTREQTPWHFPAWIADTNIGTLQTGDYALKGDMSFAIERKSMNDFVGTISSGWERFRREISRMEAWCARVVIVEGNFSEAVFSSLPDGSMLNPCHDHNLVSPQFIMKRIACLTMMNVSVLFAGSPDAACALAVSIFRERLNMSDKGNDND